MKQQVAVLVFLRLVLLMVVELRGQGLQAGLKKPVLVRLPDWLGQDLAQKRRRCWLQH